MSNTTIEVLTLLEEYESIHVQGNDVWKKALWNLYKSRHSRKRHNLGYYSETDCSALDVREDLEPRTTLKVAKTGKDTATATLTCLEDGVPVIVGGNDNNKNIASRGTEDRSTDELLTTTTSVSSDDGDTSNVPVLAKEDSPFSDGLRHRRGGPAKNQDDKNEWTVVQERETKEEEKDKSSDKSAVDPLEMIAGAFPPRELKQAQKQAKEALQHYIQSANLLIRLQQLLQQEETKQSATASSS